MSNRNILKKRPTLVRHIRLYVDLWKKIEKEAIKVDRTTGVMANILLMEALDARNEKL